VSGERTLAQSIALRIDDEDKSDHAAVGGLGHKNRSCRMQTADPLVAADMPGY